MIFDAFRQSFRPNLNNFDQLGCSWHSRSLAKWDKSCQVWQTVVFSPRNFIENGTSAAKCGKGLPCVGHISRDLTKLRGNFSDFGVHFGKVFDQTWVHGKGKDTTRRFRVHFGEVFDQLGYMGHNSRGTATYANSRPTKFAPHDAKRVANLVEF